MSAAPVFGLILAGGLGRRMQAGPEAPPKPLVLLDGRPLIAHVVERLRPQVERLAINANGPPEPYAPFGLPVLADVLPGHRGPLAGILAGLDHLAGTMPHAVMVSVPADTPFIPADLVARLLARHRETGGVVHASSAGRAHPVIALWPAAARHTIAAALAAGEPRVMRLVAELGAVAEDWPADAGAAGADPFFNVNTTEDLEMARLCRPCP